MIAITGFNGRAEPSSERRPWRIIACGLVYTLIGLVVMKIGTRWIERLMPPVVTGAVVMAIGLNGADCRAQRLRQRLRQLDGGVNCALHRHSGGIYPRDAAATADPRSA